MLNTILTLQKLKDVVSGAWVDSGVFIEEFEFVGRVDGDENNDYINYQNLYNNNKSIALEMDYSCFSRINPNH